MAKRAKTENEKWAEQFYLDWSAAWKKVSELPSVPDHGTCNLDEPVITASRRQCAAVNKLAGQGILHPFSSRLWRGQASVLFPCSGSAAERTYRAEAMARELKEKYGGGMYYQMD